MLNQGVNINVTVNSEPKNVLQFTHSKSIVQNTSSMIIVANQERKYLLIVNNSDTDIFLSLNENAEIGIGIPVNAGGSYQMSSEYVSKGVIYAIHSGEGDKEILITEGV